MNERITAAQYQQGALKPKAKKSKYRNQRTVFDGVTYHSKAEARYAAGLKLLCKARLIGNVQTQVPFLITVDGILITTYLADFVFDDYRENRTRVVDVKGFETAEFKIKKKLVEAMHKVKIECVKVNK